MVSPPDSENPPTAPEENLDITQNGATPADGVDAVPDLRLQPEGDSLSTFGPEHALLEQQDSVPLHVPTQAQPTRGDTVEPDTYIVWPAADDDRSWRSRLRSLKASWETRRLRRSGHDEPLVTDADVPVPAARTGEMTMEAVRSFEKHLASLTALHDACASIDRRLARVEEATRQRDQAWIDEALHDVCRQMSDRLVRVEGSVQRTEGYVTRLERVEETVQLTQQSLADSTLPETCVNIEKQLVQARMALQRTEEAVADKTLHELYKNVDARLGRIEDTLHSREGTVAEWLQELSEHMTARFAETDEAIQRIEGIVSSNNFEQTFSQQPSVRTDDRPVHAARRTSESGEPANGVLARAAILLSRFVNIEQMNRPIRRPWITGLAVPVLLFVAVLAIGSLFRTNRGGAPDKIVPLTTSDQVLAPAEPATNQGVRSVSTTTVIADTSRPTRESPVSTSRQRSAEPQQPPPDRKSGPTTSGSPRFVGTLSITSIPSGASVSINGKPAGVTPLRLTGQRAGSLAVQVAHDGFERWSAAVSVPADQLTQVSAKLRASAR